MTIKKIIIIGPFNSGTNLIENLLINNCYHENKNLISVVKNNTIYWKHTLNMKLLETICDENTLIIIMYKEIYNWIASAQISKYWFNFNKINDKIQFNVDKNASVIEKKFHQNCSFDNIIEVYNSYYNAYKNLKNQCNLINYIDQDIINFYDNC